ncbi:cell division ATP-binding protein FtsE [Candidatus Peregrinibacteria bacterium]|nr:cell division ATP-binding protein FtsE [Candidatus Peregrinibacteria bacterium]
MIVLKNVGKTFGSVKVLESISFRINPGEFVCITGKSGAGKSTLLHLLTGAEMISRGSIEIDGVDLRTVPAPVMQLFRRRLGIVFQDYKLLRNRTVAENIAFPLEVCGVPDAEITKRVRTVLAQMDLTKHANTLPAALSGGEKARTAIARAVVHSPLILLADEPTGNIDPEQSLEIMRLFREIHAKGTTVVIATHDTGLVDELQTRVIELKDGKVSRDSVGGYAKTKHGAEPHVASHGKHDVCKEESDTGNHRRKVRVTAVSS